MTNTQQNSLLHRAIAAHQAGRIAEAEAGYHAVLRSRPNDADALHFMGMLRMHQGRLDAAIEFVQRSLKIVPSNPHAWNNLGNMLLTANRDDEAEHAYQQATNLAPKMAQAWFNLGLLLRRKRQPEQALASFRRVIDSNPRFAVAYEHLALLLYKMGRPDHAADVYRKWLEVEPDHPTARHMVAASTGTAAPERADDQYVATLFDGYASGFDDSLQRLGYAAPQLLASAIADHVHFGRGDLQILDAGCGTGLCGMLLRSSASKMVGVDLSEGMLAKAASRKIYDELAEQELCAFMRGRPEEFHVVVSGDTLVYFGALEEATQAARSCMKAGGVLAFTLEAAPADCTEGYRIQVHGRYCHREDYVRQVLEGGGFEVLQIDPVVLRKELGEDVKGHLVVGRARNS